MIVAAILSGLLQPPSGATIRISTTTSVSYPADIRDQAGECLSCMTDKADAAMHAPGVVSEGAEIRGIYAQACADCATLRGMMVVQDNQIFKAEHWSGKRKHTIADGFAHARKNGESSAATVARMNAPKRPHQGKANNAPN